MRMTQMLCVGGVVSAALCFGALAHGEGTSTAEAGWAKMTQCAAIGDDKARHTCTDNALRDAGLLSDETKATAKRKAFGLQKPATLAEAAAPPAAAASASAPASASAASAPTSASLPGSASASAPAPRKPEKEHLEVTLAKVEQGADGKLVLTTADGAVWHQVEGGPLSQTPKQGDTLKIEARSLGGFMCQPSKYVSFRCYRSK